MLKYIFMGSPPIAANILETLCTELYPPTAVVTQVAKAKGRGQKITPTAVEKAAKQKGLQVIATSNVNTPQCLDQIRSFEPHVILVAAFGQIFKEELLSLPKRYCLNIHASLLPKYRGAAPIQWAIWNGDKTTGITIQKMVKKLDAGDILLRDEFEILPIETSGELLERMGNRGAQLAIKAIRLIEKDKETFIPQDESQATYAPKIDRSHARIDWNNKSSHIFNQIRALQPWPVAETRLGKERFQIYKATIISAKNSLAPGAIETDSRSHLYVQCGDDALLSLTEIQAENRKRLDIKEFLKAFRGVFPFRQMD